MSFPKNIRSVSKGVIAMMIDEETEIFICPNGKVFTKKEFDSSYIMYDQYEHYPNQMAYCGNINQDFKPDGEGKFLFYADSHYATYVGGVEEGHIRGEGVLTWRNGTVEEGMFGKGKFKGKRTYTRGEDFDVLVGTWNDDTLDMLETADFADGRRIFNTSRGSAEHFIKGTMILPDVGEFVGEIWKQSFQLYRGKMTYLDGRIHEGEFDYNHAMHGNGKMTLPNGTSYAGKWKNGHICILVPGIFALAGKHQGEIRGLPTVRFMADHLDMDAFSYTDNEDVEEPQEKFDYDKWLEKRNNYAEGYEEEEDD